MKRSYRLEGLCCANCAAEMEREINKLDGVQDANIAFMSQRLHLEAADMDAALDAAQAIISKIERGCKILR